MKISFPLRSTVAVAGTDVVFPEYAHKILMSLGVTTLEGWKVSVSPGSLKFSHSSDTWGGGDFVLRLIAQTLRRNFEKQPKTLDDYDKTKRWDLVIDDRMVIIDLRISTGCKERAYFTTITIS